MLVQRLDSGDCHSRLNAIWRMSAYPSALPLYSFSYKCKRSVDLQKKIKELEIYIVRTSHYAAFAAMAIKPLGNYYYYERQFGERWLSVNGTPSAAATKEYIDYQLFAISIGLASGAMRLNNADPAMLPEVIELTRRAFYQKLGFNQNAKVNLLVKPKFLGGVFSRQNDDEKYFQHALNEITEVVARDKEEQYRCLPQTFQLVRDTEIFFEPSVRWTAAAFVSTFYCRLLHYMELKHNVIPLDGWISRQFSYDQNDRLKSVYYLSRDLSDAYNALLSQN